uniref:Uncharacterized protein n=1 Tax=Hyaloperonospora arabidopsidis (strain Emoy2) TaxID=559515 RepID=M4BH24_HYAAE
MTTTEKNSGHRRVKQMQGLLLLSRLDGAPARRPPKTKPQRMTVLLQPQLQQLVYSSRADQDMLQPLGRVCLRDAKLEQLSDGFIIHEARGGLCKVSGWSWSISLCLKRGRGRVGFGREPKRPTVRCGGGDDVGYKFAAVLTSRMRDEHTDGMEFELSCRLVLPAHERNEKSSVQWSVWKTLAELQAFDE